MNWNRPRADEVAAPREAMRLQRVRCDRLANAGHARRISERQIALRDEGLAGDHGELPWRGKLVIVERGLLVGVCLPHVSCLW